MITYQSQKKMQFNSQNEETKDSFYPPKPHLNYHDREKHIEFDLLLENQKQDIDSLLKTDYLSKEAAKVQFQKIQRDCNNFIGSLLEDLVLSNQKSKFLQQYYDQVIRQMKAQHQKITQQSIILKRKLQDCCEYAQQQKGRFQIQLKKIIEEKYFQVQKLQTKIKYLMDNNIQLTELLQERGKSDLQLKGIVSSLKNVRDLQRDYKQIYQQNQGLNKLVQEYQQQLKINEEKFNQMSRNLTNKISQTKSLQITNAELECEIQSLKAIIVQRDLEKQLLIPTIQLLKKDNEKIIRQNERLDLKNQEIRAKESENLKLFYENDRLQQLIGNYENKIEKINQKIIEQKDQNTKLKEQLQRSESIIKDKSEILKFFEKDWQQKISQYQAKTANSLARLREKYKQKITKIKKISIKRVKQLKESHLKFRNQIQKDLLLGWKLVQRSVKDCIRSSLL